MAEKQGVIAFSRQLVRAGRNFGQFSQHYSSRASVPHENYLRKSRDLSVKLFRAEKELNASAIERETEEFQKTYEFAFLVYFNSL